MLTDTKINFVDKIQIGSTSTSGEVIEGIVRFSERLASPDGALVKPVPVINLINPATTINSHTFYEMELELDSDNITAMREQVVTNASTTTRVLRDNSENDRVDRFIVNSVNTSCQIVSYLYETQKVWLSAAAGGVSNRPGTARNTSVYKFLCIGSRTIGSTEITATQTGDERYTGIQKVELTSGTLVATNILDYNWSLVGPDGGDIVAPRFTPNTYDAVGTLEFSGKHWIITLAFDTYTTIFNNYIKQTSGQVVIPSGVNIYLTKSDGTTRVHTYQSGMCWVRGYAPSNVIEKDTYHPGVVELVCIGQRIDS